MARHAAGSSLVAALAIACTAPSPTPASPQPSAQTWVGREPASPPGTLGLRAAPCSPRFDLSAATAEERAFGPASDALSARTTLPFRVLHPSVTWRWSSSRPDAVRFVETAPGRVDLLAGEPGLTLVRLSTEPLDETTEPSDVSALVSVPLFVRVRGDGELAATLDRDLGLAGRELEVMAQAKRVLCHLYAHVNLRVAFELGRGETLPPELGPGDVVEATVHGRLSSCATPRESLLYTEFGGYGEGDGGRRLVVAPIHVCPGIFVRHPDTMAAIVAHRDRLLAAAPTSQLYVTVVGRALGELLAHEIGHQLLGCDTRGERRFWRCHDRLPRSLMNKAGERSFADRTGIIVLPTYASSTWRDDFPGPGTYEDRGVEAINALSPESQAVLDRLLPVPPALAEQPACP